jgi:hypothetical protein
VPLVLFLSDVSVGIVDVSAKASFADILNCKFPNQYYTNARFPSIYSG